jgi:hypothetical protein
MKTLEEYDYFVVLLLLIEHIFITKSIMFHVYLHLFNSSGAGKTYSMGSAWCDDDGDLNQQSGIIPRACHDLFETIKTKCDGNGMVELSYLEIYNEELRDLLSDQQPAPELKIRENLQKSVYVSGLSSHLVKTPCEIRTLLERASKRRQVGATAMNAVSSRSHALCILKIKGNIISGDDEETFESSLTLVDLAGSERLKKTGAVGNRRTEGININKSLLVLGQVVSALSAGRTKPPYRDSKLTRLLQDSLGGNSRTILLACVSPDAANLDETINTLRYATSARNITNTATRNVVTQISPEEAAKILRENQLLQAQVAELQKSLQQLVRTSSSSPPCTPVSCASCNAPTLASTVSFESASEVSSINSDTNKESAYPVEDNSLPKSNTEGLQAEVESLRRELRETKQQLALQQNCSSEAAAAVIELPALRVEVERLRDQSRELEALQEQNQCMQIEMAELRADALASRSAASKLAEIMDKLQELKSDQLEKKRLEYEHTKKEEAWVNFLVKMLQTRHVEMQQLGQDFDLVVRVVESATSTPELSMVCTTGTKKVDPMDESSTSRLGGRWLRKHIAKGKENNHEQHETRQDDYQAASVMVEIRQELLKKHVKFFHDKMEDIKKCIAIEEKELIGIQSHLMKDTERLETEIGVDEFVKHSLNSKDEDLLQKLTTVLIGPVQQV